MRKPVISCPGRRLVSICGVSSGRRCRSSTSSERRLPSTPCSSTSAPSATSALAKSPGVIRDAMFADPEHCEPAIDAKLGGAAGTGFALVAGCPASIAKIVAAGALQHGAAERRHIAQLRACRLQERLGKHGIIAADERVVGGFRHAHQRAAPKSAVISRDRPKLGLQRGDVDDAPCRGTSSFISRAGSFRPPDKPAQRGHLPRAAALAARFLLVPGRTAASPGPWRWPHLLHLRSRQAPRHGHIRRIVPARTASGERHAFEKCGELLLRHVEPGEWLPFGPRRHAHVALKESHLVPVHQPGVVILVAGEGQAIALDRVGDERSAGRPQPRERQPGPSPGCGRRGWSSAAAARRRHARRGSRGSGGSG